jgi:poly(hydroxyalkanoate) depolymerase family esterase
MKPMLDKLIDQATRLTRSGKLAEATATIQRALVGDAVLQPGRPVAKLDVGTLGLGVLGGPVHGLRPSAPPAAPAPGTGAAPENTPRSDPRTPSFAEGVYTGPAGARVYKLFVPAGFAGAELPLIVMLHGCSQSPDDFAAGTRMNEVAQERGLLVLYPAQAPRSNSSKCWNWFKPEDQHRGGGEPELLAGMTRHVMATHPVDATRVYVAGLSAGGAMADILGREYPDLYAAVGIHSGLPQGAARDVASAFAAMQGGAARAPTPLKRGQGSPAPAIVFHGDRDGTVHPSNGEHVIDATLAADPAEVLVATRANDSTAGRPVTRTVHRRRSAAASEPSVAEHWLVHGAGHAWSGGSPRGSYTDPKGPDAARAMIRFFLGA